MQDFKAFVNACFYVGKGSRGRKAEHLLKAKRGSFCWKSGDNIYKRKVIVECWNSGDSVVLLQLGLDTNHFVAASNEYAVIRAIGKDNLTNSNEGHAYGIMNCRWTNRDIHENKLITS